VNKKGKVQSRVSELCCEKLVHYFQFVLLFRLLSLFIVTYLSCALRIRQLSVSHGFLDFENE
jgi:hypothetical protein